MSNSRVLAKVGSATVFVELFIRRLKWLQTIVKGQAATAQVAAAIFGKLAEGPHHTIDIHIGSVHPTYRYNALKGDTYFGNQTIFLGPS